MNAERNLPASGHSDRAHLVLERRDSPRDRGFAYVAETEDDAPVVIATSATFYPERDLTVAAPALHELIARLEGEGWAQMPGDAFTIIGARFHRRPVDD